MPIGLILFIMYLGINVYFLGAVITLIVYMPCVLDGHLIYTDHFRICSTWPKVLYKKVFK